MSSKVSCGQCGKEIEETELLSTDLFRDDTLPKNVCQDCYDEIAESGDYKADYECIDCNFKISRENILYSHHYRIEPECLEGVWFCDDCMICNSLECIKCKEQILRNDKNYEKIMEMEGKVICYKCEDEDEDGIKPDFNVVRACMSLTASPSGPIAICINCESEYELNEELYLNYCEECEHRADMYY